MAVAAKNYELLTLELHAHRRELDPVLLTQFETLFNRIREDLLKDRDIINSCEELIESIFAIRIKGLVWLSKQKHLKLEEILVDAEELISELSTKENLEVLSENLGFALRTIRRVTSSIISKVSEKALTDDMIEMPEIDYWTYFDMLSMAIPNEELLEKIMEWVDSSLELEYSMIAAILIHEENLNINQSTIDDLANLIALATQDYGAYSVELGIMPMYSLKANKEYPIPEDSDFIKEQQLLADSGLEDLGPNLDKE